MIAIIDQTSTWKKLTAFSLRWYFYVMREVLVKYKVALLFFVCLLAPTGTSIFKLVDWPVNIYLQRAPASIAMFAAVVMGVQVYSILLGVIHKPVLRGRIWDPYIKSLAISAVEKRISDLTVLIIANGFLISVLFYGYILIFLSSSFHWVELTGRILFLIMMMFSIQLSIVYQQYQKLLFPMILGMSLILSTRYMPSSATIVLLWLGSYALYRLLFAVPSDVERTIQFNRILVGMPSSYFMSLVRINLKLMLEDYKANMMRLLPALIVAVAYIMLLLTNTLPNNIAYNAFLLILLTNCFFVSNLYKPIYMQWQQYKGYCLSLPISSFHFNTSMGFIGLLTILPLSLIECLVFSHIVRNYAVINYFYDFIAWLVCLLLCCAIQLKLKRYGVLMSSIAIIPLFMILKTISL